MKNNKNNLWEICYGSKKNIKCTICNKIYIKKHNYEVSKIIYDEEDNLDNLVPSCNNCYKKINCDLYDYNMEAYKRMIEIRKKIGNNYKAQYDLHNYMDIDI